MNRTVGTMSTSETKKTVLLVDDDQDFLFQQITQLVAAGFAVLEANSVKEALAIVAKTKPDIALVDLMMEENDAGFQLCYKLKKRDKAIPIIMVTSVASEAGIEFDAATDEERSWVKADTLLMKPVRFEQLKREIDRLLN